MQNNHYSNLSVINDVFAKTSNPKREDSNLNCPEVDLVDSRKGLPFISDHLYETGSVQTILSQNMYLDSRVSNMNPLFLSFQ